MSKRLPLYRGSLFSWLRSQPGYLKFLASWPRKITVLRDLPVVTLEVLNLQRVDFQESGIKFSFDNIGAGAANEFHAVPVASFQLALDAIKCRALDLHELLMALLALRCGLWHRVSLANVSACIKKTAEAAYGGGLTLRSFSLSTSQHTTGVNTFQPSM